MLRIKQFKTIFEMKKDRIDREFSPHFYKYFWPFFEDPMLFVRYSEACKHIFDISRANEKAVLDIGCGYGLISIHLAVFGARTVTGVDLNRERISVFKKILSKFYPPLNIEVKIGDALEFGFKDECFDMVLANDFISHVRNLNSFLLETKRVLRKGGVFYIRDDNNALNVIQKLTRKRWRIWNRAEYGPVDKMPLGAKLWGTDKPLPWLLIREKMIEERFPAIDAKTLELLSKETAGMYSDEIFTAVEVYLRGGMIQKPTFRFRNPKTGEYLEFEFNPYRLKKRLEKLGFRAKIVRPYFGLYTSPTRRAIGRMVLWILRAFHPFSLVIANRFEILAKKEHNRRSVSLLAEIDLE